MRRVVCREFGPVTDLDLVEEPDPVPGPGEVLVEVLACGVSFVDGLIVRGEYQIRPPRPFTPGSVVAGRVVACGPGVGDLRVGDRVAGLAFLCGAYASHTVVAASALRRLPASVSVETAATAIESYATMLFAFTRRTTVARGDWVVVLGAGGGIGLAAVDLARSMGGRVLAVASTPAKRMAARGAGAEAALDPADGDLKTGIRDATGGGADVVVDPVGGALAEPALRALRRFGRYLVIGFASGRIPALPLNQVLLNNRSVIGVDWGAWSAGEPEDNGRLIEDLLGRLARAELVPPEPARHPLSEAPRVLSELHGRRAVGKLVLIP
ncbi:NADPH:quinone oxidoreductase family protein [Amycolatopsis thermoflava]|uniref:NADPH:quinone oxidoreductase family protein n=1 Tax=Amycolatopsis thermoflava TaxID=84480 RepID=UPI0037F4AE95